MEAAHRYPDDPPVYNLQDPAVHNPNGLSLGHHRIRTRALGRPSKKRLFTASDSIVLVASFSCLLLAHLVITPGLSFAWRLQYTGQIVVIGFLLSVMNVCMTTLSPYACLLLEARFGPSLLQNYEAILNCKITKSNVSLVWRAILLILIILPMGLSIAYKRFLHGLSTFHIPSDPMGRYGIDFPQVGDFAPTNDPIYFTITNLNPFQAAWNEQLYPAKEDFPVAYGYNTLLLSDSSAAILDVPRFDYVKRMQNSMKVGEAWRLSATVNAYLASYNLSTPALRRDDSFWDQAVDSSLKLHPDYALVTMNMWFHNTRIGSMPFGNGNEILVGLYNDSTTKSLNLEYLNNRTEPSFNSFRAMAGLYNIRRVKCRGDWYMNKTGISLSSGHCDYPDLVDQSIVENQGLYSGGGFYPYQMDTMPVFGHFFTVAAESPDWPWLNATYAVSVATSYWARAVFLLKLYGIPANSDDSISYTPDFENILSFRSTLHPSRWLYLVLAVQPLLTVFAFAISLVLRKVPIERGFGITAILSGFDSSKPLLIDGAALSGELKKPVRLKITADLPDQDLLSLDGSLDCSARIRYRLSSGRNPPKRSSLQRGRLYW